MNRSATVLFAMFALVLLVGLALPVHAANEDSTDGRIKSLNVDKSEFVLTDKNNKNWTFTLGEKAKVQINDKDAKFSELKTEDSVTVTYLKQGSKFLAEKIACTRK